MSNLDVNRLVLLHNANHHNVGLGIGAKRAKQLWQPLVRLGLIDKGSIQYCGVVSITRKGRQLLQQPHSQIAAILKVDESKVVEVLDLKFGE
jgi:predicted transcriptional regulator